MKGNGWRADQELQAELGPSLEAWHVEGHVVASARLVAAADWPLQSAAGHPPQAPSLPPPPPAWVSHLHSTTGDLASMQTRSFER